MPRVPKIMPKKPKQVKEVEKIARGIAKLMPRATRSPKKASMAQRRKNKERNAARTKEKASAQAKQLTKQKRTYKKSQDTLAEMRRKGFRVDINEKEFDKAASKAMTDKEWKNWKKKYSSGSLKKKATRHTDRIRVADANKRFIHIDDTETGLHYNELFNEKKLADAVNRMRTVKMPVPDWSKDKTAQGLQPMQMRHVNSNDEASMLSEIVYLLSGEDPVAGMVTDFFTIDADYDEEKPWTLAEHINFLKIPYSEEIEDVMMRYSELAYTDRGLWEIYMQKRQKRAGQKILDDMKVDETTRAVLSSILESSHMYAIASREAPPSSAAEAAYAHMTQITVEAQKTSQEIFARIVQMIVNESDYEDIVYEFNQMIEEMRQGQEEVSTSDGD